MLWVGFGVFVIVLVYFVVQEFQPEEVTLEEYAETVCSSGGLPDDATWGEAQQVLRDQLDNYKGLKPPAELLPFHTGRISALEGVLRALEDKDGDSPMNEFELALDSEMHEAMRADEAGVRSLSVEHHRLLRQHGCNL